MAHDPQAELDLLTQKLRSESPEKLSIDDFTGFWDSIEAALADGKLGLFEIVGLIRQGIELLSKMSQVFKTGGSPQPDFGFLRTQTPPQA